MQKLRSSGPLDGPCSGSCCLLLPPHPHPRPPSMWLGTLDWELHLQTGSSCNLLTGCLRPLCLGHRKLKAEACTVGWSPLLWCTRLLLRCCCVACALPPATLRSWAPACNLPSTPQARLCGVPCSAGSGAPPKALDPTKVVGVQLGGTSLGVHTFRGKPNLFHLFGAGQGQGRTGSPGWPPTPGFTGVLPHAQPRVEDRFSVFKHSWGDSDY